jgi:hypothetical protein
MRHIILAAALTSLATSKGPRHRSERLLVEARPRSSKRAAAAGRAARGGRKLEGVSEAIMDEVLAKIPIFE